MTFAKRIRQAALVLGGLAFAYSTTGHRIASKSEITEILHRSPKSFCEYAGVPPSDTLNEFSYLLPRHAQSPVCPALENPMSDIPTLWQAASVGDIGSIQLLLSNGADVNSVDDPSGTEYTALHHAAAQGQSLVVRLLLRHNVDTSRFGSEGMTALHLAAQNGHEEAVEILLQHGVDVNQQTEFDRLTPLHVAAEAGNLSVVHVLLRHNADIASTDAVGNSALHFSAKHGHGEMTHVLITQGADVHAQNEFHDSPLHLATLSGDESAVRVLVEHGADPWTGHSPGLTPLEYAIEEGHANVVRWLLSQDRFPVRKPDGEAALVVAAGRRQEPFVKLLLDMGFDVNSTRDSFQSHRIPTMRGQMITMAELEQQSDLHVDLWGPWSALHAAVHNGNHMMVRLLLEKDADPNSVDAGGWTPLHTAACGDSDIVSLLLEYGADASSRDKQGCIPLHWAVAGSVARVHAGGWSSRGRDPMIQKEIVLHLVRHTTDIDMKNNEGQTALHWAVRYGETTIAEELVRQQADLRATDVYGRTPLDWAIECGRTDMREILT